MPEAKVKTHRKRRIVRLLHKLNSECTRAIGESMPGASRGREQIDSNELAGIYRARALAIGTLQHFGANQNTRRAS